MGAVRRSYGVGACQVNNITPIDTHSPNNWARDLEKLDYGSAPLIETPYAGGFRYWAGVGLYG